MIGQKTQYGLGCMKYYLKMINIPNFYEFKQNLSLNDSNTLGFAARCEGRKNPSLLRWIKILHIHKSQQNLT